MIADTIRHELSDLRHNADALAPLLAVDGDYLQAEALLLLAEVNGRLEDLATRLTNATAGNAVALDTSLAGAVQTPQATNGPIRGRRCL